MKPWTLATSCNVQQLSQCFFLCHFVGPEGLHLVEMEMQRHFHHVAVCFHHVAVCFSCTLLQNVSLCQTCSQEVPHCAEKYAARVRCSVPVTLRRQLWSPTRWADMYSMAPTGTFIKHLLKWSPFCGSEVLHDQSEMLVDGKRKKRSHQNVFEEHFRLIQLLLSKPKLKILLFSRTCAIIPLPQGCLPFYGSVPMCGVKEKNRLFLAQAREKLLTT